MNGIISTSGSASVQKLPAQSFLFLHLAECLSSSLFVLHEQAGLLAPLLSQGAVFSSVSTLCGTSGSVEGFAPGGDCGNEIYIYLT